MKEINPNINLRLNTNGLSDLINGKPTAKELSSVFDYISVSLNEPDSENMIKLHEIALRAKHLMQCSNLLKNVLHTVLK